MGQIFSPKKLQPRYEVAQSDHEWAEACIVDWESNDVDKDNAIIDIIAHFPRRNYAVLMCDVLNVFEDRKRKENGTV
jgi:hypothetical protein